MILNITVLVITSLIILSYFLVYRKDFFSKSSFRKYSNSIKDKNYIRSVKIKMTLLSLLYIIYTIVIYLFYVVFFPSNFIYLSGYDFYVPLTMTYIAISLIVPPILNIIITPKIMERKSENRIKIYDSARDYYLCITSLDLICILLLIKYIVDLILLIILPWLWKVVFC